MALGIVLTAANVAQKALKGSGNAKGNLFKGLQGKLSKVRDGIKDMVGDNMDKGVEHENGHGITNGGAGTETEMELRGRREREAEAKRQEEERLKAEAAKKNKMYMYAALALGLFLMMKKKR